VLRQTLCGVKFWIAITRARFDRGAINDFPVLYQTSCGVTGCVAMTSPDYSRRVSGVGGFALVRCASQIALNTECRRRIVVFADV